MKKLTALLLIFALIFGLSACVRDDLSSDFSQNSTPKIKESGKKLSGKIINSSNFSHGLALVCVEGDGNKTYCINKKGNIVFEIEDTYHTSILIDNISTITDSYVLYDNAIYDLKGNVTVPEDFGVTKFYGIALEGGYILAENVVADFSSTKKELCVFDEEFNLIIQPSEELYSAVEGVLDSLDSILTNSYYYNDFVYFCNYDNHKDNSCYLNLKTGEITYEAPFELPSSQWTTYDSCYMEKIDPNNAENIRLDLREYDNIYTLGKFKNRKAPIIFINNDINASFFTLIDEQGNFQFEPVQAPTSSTIKYDGLDTIIFIYGRNGRSVRSYNSKGEFLGELENDNIYKSYYFDISDGVIRIYTSNTSSDEILFYNPDLTPLF